MSPLWFYFGCGRREAGHYLFTEGGNQFHSYDDWRRKALNHFDGVLPPHPESSQSLYQASFNVLGGPQMCALSWWDRSQDKRAGSNSTIFAPGLSWEPEAMLVEAQTRFPWVFARLPQPITLQPPSAGGGGPKP